MWGNTLALLGQNRFLGECNSIFDSQSNLFFCPMEFLNFYFWPQGGIWFSLMQESHISSHPSHWKPASGSVSGSLLYQNIFQMAASLKEIALTYVCLGASKQTFFLSGKSYLNQGVLVHLKVLQLIIGLSTYRRLGTFPMSFFAFQPREEAWSILTYVPHTYRFAYEKEGMKKAYLNLPFKLGLYKVHARNNRKGKTHKTNCLRSRPLLWVRSLDLRGEGSSLIGSPLLPLYLSQY